MHRLQNTIQTYAWGSKTAIAELLRQENPSNTPQAELWLGAHPLAPSSTPHGSLLSLISSEPEAALGRAIAKRFDGRLPFLLKVLAAEAPLSLQAHPNLEQARAGFAREETLGIALTASHRNYKDQNHKPELLCALSPFEALCGFRDVLEAARLFDALDEAPLAPLARDLRLGQLQSVFERLMTLPPKWKDSLLTAVEPKLEVLANKPGPASTAYRWAATLSKAYPKDIGALSSLLLNYVELKPGQALYLGAGNLHAYLRGVGIELMANSDNVLRGGLTSKHVDVPELLKVLEFVPGPVKVLEPSETVPGEWRYATPAPDFALSMLKLGAGLTLTPDRHGPEILLCTEGTVSVGIDGSTLELQPGESLWVPAADGRYTLSGTGIVYRASVPDVT